MKVGYASELDDNPSEITEAGNRWQMEALKIRPLQPFEDFYKAVRAFEAGVEWARNNTENKK
jgi:hypothetical protein